MKDLENNKVFASILLAGVIFMATGIFAEELVKPEKLKEQAYKVEGLAVAETGGGGNEAIDIPVVSHLLATANVDAGKEVFKKCTACHTPEKGGPNKVGPNLWGVVGGKKAHLEGFAYSPALKARADGGEKWGYEELNHFLYKPQAYVKGTKMVFAGLRKDQERADVIAYLRSLSDSPVALPTAAEIEALQQKKTAKDAPASEAAGKEAGAGSAASKTVAPAQDAPSGNAATAKPEATETAKPAPAAGKTQDPAAKPQEQEKDVKGKDADAKAAGAAGAGASATTPGKSPDALKAPAVKDPKAKDADGKKSGTGR